MIRLAVLFSAIVVAYDALAAAIAKGLVISYGSFVVPEAVLFVFMGIYAGRKMGGWNGFAPVLIAAIANGTLGWYVAALIGPGAMPPGQISTAAFQLASYILVPAVFGAAGVATGIRVNRTQR